jgi:predicted dehydrogenase
MTTRKLRMGMIGGGPGAFIGAIHRHAANMDGMIELVAGSFSSDPEKSAQAGLGLHLPPNRVYGSYKEMIRREAELPATERMDFVSIVTPNHLHFDPARLALESGFHVVLDKPMTFDVDEAKRLQAIVEKSGLFFCLTHTYTGYPMVKEARQQVLSGKFGRIRKIYVEYPQGWLSTALESKENKQAAWRTDPSRSGIAGAMGDIGTHAFNLAEYVSGLKTESLCADVNIVVTGRRLDDDGAALLRYDNGASGVLIATQVAAGEENNVKVRVYGENGGLEWQQCDANTLMIKWPDRPAEVWRAGTGYVSSFASHNTRTPSGHPEGYLEAFANHYRNFTLSVMAKMEGKIPKDEWLDFPGIEAGVRGMQFIDTIVRSGKSEKWENLNA